MVICVDVVLRRAPSLEAGRMSRRYRDVWYSPLSRRGLTCRRKCLDGLVEACVVPRSSSERDVSRGRVDVEASPVAVEGVGGCVCGWYRIQ